MLYEEIVNEESFHEWFKYEPHDAQYVRYSESNPSALAAGQKIGDVYHTFAMARASLLYSLESDYGYLAKREDELSMLNVRSIFVHNAILNYAICEDLSWQVAWAYIQPADIKYLMNNQYEKMSKECNRDNLLEQLNCGIAQNSMQAGRIKRIIQNFDNDKKVQEFRILYNYLKHRGNIHIDGLGNDDKHLMIVINNEPVEILHHETYSLIQLQDMIWNYHKSFLLYFNSLIAEIMPNDFTNNSTTLNEYILSAIQMAEAQGKIVFPE